MFSWQLYEWQNTQFLKCTIWLRILPLTKKTSHISTQLRMYVNQSLFFGLKLGFSFTLKFVLFIDLYSKILIYVKIKVIKYFDFVVVCVFNRSKHIKY